MVYKMLSFFIVLTLVLWISGCSDNPSNTNLTDGELNLEDEFGGYSAKSENPGFGDTELLDEAAADEEYDDPMLVSPEVDSMITEPKSGHFHLRAVWGRLRYDSTVTEQTDWTGSLTISEGAIVIRRVIRFELGQDYIPTRTDRRVVDWVSYTTVHNDGIAVDLYVRPAFDTTWVEEITNENDTILVPVVDTVYPDGDSITVAFETGPYSRTFMLSELTALDTVIELDDSNAVAFHAVQLHRFQCRKGFLSGHWGFNEEGDGQFRGMWMNRMGDIIGYLTGHFGQNEDGLKVFFGKWISANGRFEGFVKGIYGHHPNDHANPRAFRRAGGWFQGYIYDSERARIGVLKGKFKSSDERRGGFFQARWKLYCNDLEADNSDIEEGF